MNDYIKIGNWKSSDVTGLHVMEWEAPLMARAGRQAFSIPGRMEAITDRRRDWQPEHIPVTMALVGNGRATLRQQFRAISRQLHHADHLILSDMPDNHYRGYTSEIKVLEDYEEWTKFRLYFLANPPCLLRAISQQAGFIPTAGTPIPEQLTDANASQVLDATGAASLVISDGVAAYDPEIYLSITGTWQQLHIGQGGIILPARDVSDTVYIDAQAEVAYTLSSGVRTPVPDITGSYQALTQGAQLAISGSSISIHVRLMRIERS